MLVLLAAPLVSIYFTVLILYSYKIHGVLAGYLREGLEPELARLCATPADLEWEKYYARHQVPGIRRGFFVTALWVVSVVAVLPVLYSQRGDSLAWGAVWAVAGLYLTACILITIWSGKRTKVGVLLDRDGTINKDTHYTHRAQDLEFNAGALGGLALLATLPVHIVVVTNQAGIALGLYPQEQMSAFNAALRREVEDAGGRIDAFYFCPHKERKNLASGEPACECSKPRPGMLREAAVDFGLDLSRSYFIGDKSSDVIAGRAAGCQTVLLTTGKAGREEGAVAVDPDLVADSLTEAARWVAERERDATGRAELARVSRAD